MLLILKSKHFFYNRTPNNKKDELFNHILTWMKQNKWGFTSQQVSSLGTHIVSTLTEALWLLDPFWERLNPREINVPKPFTPKTGYQDL